MDPNLIIDDGYVTRARNHCLFYGNKLEEILNSYCAILGEIQEEALVSGEISEALTMFISCVASIKGKLPETARTIQTAGEAFIQEINTADEYLF